MKSIYIKNLYDRKVYTDNNISHIIEKINAGKNITFDEAVLMHQLMWSWIYENWKPESCLVLKRVFLGYVGITELVPQSCFLCKFVDDISHQLYHYGCKIGSLCPGDWAAINPDGYSGCSSGVDDTIYDRVGCDREAAKTIATMPMKQEIKRNE